jgi:hypothetical protein
MPRYVIEREIPGAGQFSPAELRVISQKSVGVLNEIAGGLTWLETFIVDDKMYCIYDAPGPELIHEHARCMGIPANRISEIRATIGPSTATS